MSDAGWVILTMAGLFWLGYALGYARCHFTRMLRDGDVEVPPSEVRPATPEDVDADPTLAADWWKRGEKPYGDAS